MSTGKTKTAEKQPPVVESRYQDNHRWIKRALSGQTDAILTLLTQAAAPLGVIHSRTTLITATYADFFRLKRESAATKQRAVGHALAFQFVNVFIIAPITVLLLTGITAEPETQSLLVWLRPVCDALQLPWQQRSEFESIKP